MKIEDLRIKDEIDFMDVEFATAKEIRKFKKDIFDVDEIFIFMEYPCRICKYLNIIGSISIWGQILHSFKLDFQLPLFYFWHYYLKGEAIHYDDCIAKNNGDPKIEKFKEVFIKQFYVAMLSFIEKLKRAYSNIYNFSYNNFFKQKFLFEDKIFEGSGLKDFLLQNVNEILNFEQSPEFEKFRRLRNSSVHNIGGKKARYTFVAQNDDDFIREMTFTKENITDRQLLELLRKILPELDQLCTKFNTINLKYFLYLVQFDMPGKLIDIK